jgi:hypothetical protein
VVKGLKRLGYSSELESHRLELSKRKKETFLHIFFFLDLNEASHEKMNNFWTLQRAWATVLRSYYMTGRNSQHHECSYSTKIITQNKRKPGMSFDYVPMTRHWVHSSPTHPKVYRFASNTMAVPKLHG